MRRRIAFVIFTTALIAVGLLAFQSFQQQQPAQQPQPARWAGLPPEDMARIITIPAHPPPERPFDADWPLLIVDWTDDNGTTHRTECKGIEATKGSFSVMRDCISGMSFKNAMIEGQKIVRMEGRTILIMKGGTTLITEYYMSDKVPPVLDERRVLTYVKDGKTTKCAGGLFMAKNDYRVIGCDLTNWQGATLEGRPIVLARDFGDGTYFVRIEPS